MTNAEIRREARRRGERQLTGTFFLTYGPTYLFELAGLIYLFAPLRFWLFALYLIVDVLAYAASAWAAVAAWRRAEGAEVSAGRNRRACVNGLLAAVVFAVFQTGFSVAGAVSLAVAGEGGRYWPFWLIFAARFVLGMWLNMLFFAAAAMDGEMPLRALGRGLAGLVRQFFRIAGMQIALWWQTWLIAAAVFALGFCDPYEPMTAPLFLALLLLAVILFFWRGPRVRLACAGLAAELFGDKNGGMA